MIKPDYCNCIDGLFDSTVDWIPNRCVYCEKSFKDKEHIFNSCCGFPTSNGYICDKCHEKHDDCEESEY